MPLQTLITLHQWVPELLSYTSSRISVFYYNEISTKTVGWGEYDSDIEAELALMIVRLGRLRCMTSILEPTGGTRLL